MCRLDSELNERSDVHDVKDFHFVVCFRLVKTHHVNISMGIIWMGPRGIRQEEIIDLARGEVTA